MKRVKVAVLFLLFVLNVILSGCTTPPSEAEHQTYDSRLIGNWQSIETHEMLTFIKDGTYMITEGELANWSTAAGGKLWMLGTLHSYTLSENNTVLNITQQDYTQTFRKL